MRDLDNFALERIGTISDQFVGVPRLRLFSLIGIGIIYALLYIGDCIKEIKNE